MTRLVDVMTGRCEECGSPLPPYSGMGRPRRFCSDTCQRIHKENAAPADELCNAHCRDGHLCQNQAGKKTTHLGVGRCWLHGGRSPRAQAAGQRELRRRGAEKLLATLVPERTEPITEPSLELAALAGELRAAVTASRNLVAELDELTDGSGELRPEVALWERLTERLGKLLTDMTRVGVEAHAIRVTEEQGRQLFEVLHGILGELGVADHPEAGAVVRRHLALIAGDSDG